MGKSIKPTAHKSKKKKQARNKNPTKRPSFESDPQPSDLQFGTVEHLLMWHYLPASLITNISAEGYRPDRRACYATYLGSDFDKGFAGFTINQFAVHRGSVADLEKLKRFFLTMTPEAAAFMIIESPHEATRYDVWQVWCQRIWNEHTKARIETVWLGNPLAFLQQLAEPSNRLDLGTNREPGETGAFYPWSQSIQGIEFAQYVTGSLENVVDQVIRLSQGLRILPRLQKIGRPIGERAERGVTKKDVLKKYGELVARYGGDEGIQLRHLLSELGMSDATFRRFGFKFREIQREYKEYSQRVNEG